MRDVSLLKKENAEVYYRDKVGDRYTYVKGVVLDSKTVKEATKEWNQLWRRQGGTILKIAPKDTRTENVVRYRHLSSVLTPEQYKKRSQKHSTKDNSASKKNPKGDRTIKETTKRVGASRKTR